MTGGIFTESSRLAVKVKNGQYSENGVVNGSVTHSLMHDAHDHVTIHHIVMVVRREIHPDLLKRGRFYRCAYGSLPIAWLESFDRNLINEMGLTFYGPAGTLQRMPSNLEEFDSVCGDRFYIGIDTLNSEDDVDRIALSAIIRNRISEIKQRYLAQLKVPA